MSPTGGLLLEGSAPAGGPRAALRDGVEPGAPEWVAPEEPPHGQPASPPEAPPPPPRPTVKPRRTASPSPRATWRTNGPELRRRPVRRARARSALLRIRAARGKRFCPLCGGLRPSGGGGPFP